MMPVDLFVKPPVDLPDISQLASVSDRQNPKPSVCRDRNSNGPIRESVGLAACPARGRGAARGVRGCPEASESRSLGYTRFGAADGDAPELVLVEPPCPA